MRRATAWIAAAAVGAMVSSVTAADPLPTLGKPFEAAMERVAETTRRAEGARLLLIVRSDAGNRDPDAEADVRDALEAEIAKALRAREIAVETPPVDGDAAKVDAKEPAAPPMPSKVTEPSAEPSSKVAATDEPLVPQPAKRMLSLRDVERLLTAIPCDVVLDATWQSKGRTKSIRLALFDARKKWLLEYVPLLPDVVTQAVARRTLERAVAAKGAERTVRQPGEPRTFGGHTGFRVRRGTGAGGANGDGEGDAGENGDLEPLPPGDATGLNAKVLAFAQRNFGQQVGNGECWTLAARALDDAGAQAANMYVFGQEIPRTEITPGDVLQFERARFDRGGYYWLVGLPKHTAIVENAQGGTVTLLHQNFGSRTVTRLTLNFADQTQGRLQAYRPQPK